MRGTWIKNTVLLVAMTVAGGALLAQQAASPAAPETTPPAAAASQAAQSTTGTTGAVQLSAEQKKQLRELRMSARDQAAILRNDQTLNAEQKQAKLQELRASTRKQMKAVLTPAQQTAFAERRSEHQARMAAKLGLTPEQQGLLKALRVSNRELRQSVLINASLTNQQKRTELKQIRHSSKAQLATILTSDQLVKFQQMRKEHRHARQG